MSAEWKEIEVSWKGEMAFEGLNPGGEDILLGKLGGQKGFSPMELLLAGLAGCTGMDVVHILGKKRQDPEQFEVKVRAKRADVHPKVYTEIEIKYLLWGDDLTEKAVRQAIELSEGKYCSASAMLGKTAKIRSAYQIMSSKGAKMTEEKMINEPINVTDAAFEKTVLESDLPVIVDFWAPWCGPCKMVAPILDKIAKEYAGKVIVAKVNTDDHNEWAGKFGVRGIPTMLFMAGGKVVHQQVGALPEPMLRQVLEQLLNVVEEN